MIATATSTRGNLGRALPWAKMQKLCGWQARITLNQQKSKKMPLLGSFRLCQRCYATFLKKARWKELQQAISLTAVMAGSRSQGLQDDHGQTLLCSSQFSSRSQVKFLTTPSTHFYAQDSHDNLKSKSPNPQEAYWQNTFIASTRAMNDYLLDMDDLEGLSKRVVRTAYDNAHPIVCYHKADVEKRALEVWGSWQVLEHELNRRRLEREEEEMRRRGLSALITYLKKVNKDQIRKSQDAETFGGREERVSLMKGSAKVVLLAIASNFAVLVFKLLAYFHTGSAAMLSEAVHSLADMVNQCFLAFGIAQSIRVPDPDHPYGWSRARYVYSLISGVGVFFIGAGITSYHGVQNLLHPHIVGNLPVAYSVLAASLLVEGFTLYAALKQVRKSARESGMTFKDYVLRGRDPSAVAVLLEDSAAVAGVFLAGAAIALTHFTGNVIYDAVGSISIGALLGFVALFLVERNSNALVGQSIPPDRLKQITDLLESDIIIRSIHDVKATDMGADSVRFKAEVNFDGREVARLHVDKLDLESVMMNVQSFNSVAEMEKFLLEYGEQVIDILGAEVDRIELKIKKESPEVRHVDLEIL